MTAYAKNAGAWAPSTPYAKTSGGVWAPAKELHAKDAGVWKPVLKYPTTYLLHGEGTAGSQVIVDSSLKALTTTVYQNTQLSTSAAKFGSSSIYFDGANDAMWCDSAEFVISTDFTMEMFVNFPARGGAFSAPLFDFRNPSAPSTGVYLQFDDLESVDLYVNGTNKVASGSLAVNTWNHIALTRASNVWRLFFNGTQLGSSFTDATAFAGGYLTMGTFADTRGATRTNYQGYMDEVRFTKGLARYTANFTVPTAAFTPYE